MPKSNWESADAQKLKKKQSTRNNGLAYLSTDKNNRKHH